jgi:hypothetical protein
VPPELRQSKIVTKKTGKKREICPGGARALAQRRSDFFTELALQLFAEDL